MLIDKDLTIEGPVSGELAISGNNASRVFVITSGNNVTISDVTIQDGNVTSDGGGILNEGTLTLTNSTVSGNTTTQSGGGIFQSGGSVELTDTTVDGNTASLRGGGIENKGGALTVTRSTFSNNSTGFNGGGIFQENASSSVELINSTISGNEAQFGGGLQNSGGALIATNSTITNNTATESSGGGGIRTFNTFGGTTTLVNSIVARNVSGGDCNQANVSHGHNLDSDGTCGLGGTGDLSNVDPKLGTLEDNGGPTFTHALLEGSPAIDAGDDSICSNTDQRDFFRPFFAGACDIGAYEFGALPPLTGPPPPTPIPTITKPDDGGPGSLRQALADASSGDTIVIPTGTYTLTLGSELTINKSLTLTGAGSGETIIQAAASSVRQPLESSTS